MAPNERLLEAHVGTIVSMQLGPRSVPLGTDALFRGRPLPRHAMSILCYRPEWVLFVPRRGVLLSTSFLDLLDLGVEQRSLRFVIAGEGGPLDLVWEAPRGVAAAELADRLTGQHDALVEGLPAHELPNAAMHVAAFHDARGDRDLARRMWHTALNASDADRAAVAALRLGQDCLTRAEPDAAIRWFEQAAESGATGTRAGALNELGRLREVAGDTEGAELLYRRVHELGGDDTASEWARLSLAELLERQGRQADARELYEHVATSAHSTLAQAAAVGAGALVQRQEGPQAATRFLRDAAATGGAAAAQAALALAENRDAIGDKREAVEHYRRALDLGLDDDQIPRAWLHLGEALADSGEPEAAEKALENAASSTDRDAVVLASWRLSSLLLDRGDTDGALACCQAVIECDHPDSPMIAHASIRRGIILRKRGDLTGARNAFDQALATGTDSIFPSAWFHLADVLRRERAAEEAEAAYRRAAAYGKAPWAQFAWTGLGSLCLEAGRLPEARDAFHDALAVAEPESPAWYDIRISLAIVNDRSGEGDAARATLTDIGTTGPLTEAARAWVALAELEEGENALGPAQAAYQRAARLREPRFSPVAVVRLHRVRARLPSADGRVTRQVRITRWRHGVFLAGSAIITAIDTTAIGGVADHTAAAIATFIAGYLVLLGIHVTILKRKLGRGSVVKVLPRVRSDDLADRLPRLVRAVRRGDAAALRKQLSPTALDEGGIAKTKTLATWFASSLCRRASGSAPPTTALADSIRVKSEEFAESLPVVAPPEQIGRWVEQCFGLSMQYPAAGDWSFAINHLSCLLAIAAAAADHAGLSRVQVGDAFEAIRNVYDLELRDADRAVLQTSLWQSG